MSRQTFRLHSATLRGVEAVPVTVEVDFAGGIPGMSIVGMPDAQILEARSRVRCAIRAAGFEIPRLHVTVNLRPGDLPKSGTAFDLPLAMGILAGSGQIPIQGLEDCLVFGELGLNGEVHAVRGEMAYALLAHEHGLMLAGAVDPTLARAADAEFATILSLGDLVRPVAAYAQRDRGRVGHEAGSDGTVASGAHLDFADVVDQEQAKRALVVAAAGDHGILMKGPPGAGKTMLARRLPAILPPLEGSARMEAALVHSVAGEDIGAILAGARPFRAPHHSVSLAGLVGGGNPVTPGEISLAHQGVLFLDELPEFQKNALQALRQPTEDKEVRIVRASGTYRFPSDFQLVAAANPCPCGYYGDPRHTCQCTPARIESYQGRIGGPLVDRIDMAIDVARPSSQAIVRGEAGLDSRTMAAQVVAAREFRQWRQGEKRRGRPHEARPPASTSSARGPIEGLGFDGEALDYLEAVGRRMALGGRGMVKVASVARTIADLEQRERVSAADVAEATVFRMHSIGDGEHG